MKFSEKESELDDGCWDGERTGVAGDDDDDCRCVIDAADVLGISGLVVSYLSSISGRRYR